MRKVIIVLFILSLLVWNSYSRDVKVPVKIPPKLWMGLIGETQRNDYRGMLGIACCVRNRIERGMDHGLVAMHRPDLNDLVNEAGPQRQAQAKRIVDIVFNKRIEDITYGASHFESIKYRKPKWAYGMIPTCKIGEHIFYKQRKEHHARGL